MRQRHMRPGRTAVLSLVIAFSGLGGAAAQETVKIGVDIRMTGTSATVDREITAATNRVMTQNVDAVVGKKIELIIRDDASVPNIAKRIVQELIVNDHVNFLGAGLTPSAMSMAPL